jgi:cell division protein FtsW (lipid II flippase)
MKKALIGIIVIQYTGVALSFMMSEKFRKQSLSEVIWFLVVIAANFICARYLYNKAERSKHEWALFGFIGNLTALMIFFLFKDVVYNWRRGKRNFS